MIVWTGRRQRNPGGLARASCEGICLRQSLKGSVKWEKPLVPKPIRRSQVQLMSLGLSQVELRLRVSRMGVSPQGKESWGRTM